MIETSCLICKNRFYIKLSLVKRGWGKYCSKECQYKGQKKGKIIKCFICKKEIYKSPKELKHSKSNKFFCGKSCQSIWRNSVLYVGLRHPNWKGGQKSYRNILIRSSKPVTCKICKEGDLRILIVHHLDKDRKNNKIKNLVWLCHNCHFLVHNYKVGVDKLMETLV